MAKAKAEKPGKNSLFSFANASVADKTFYVVIGIFLTIFLILVLYPCLFVIAASFSSGGAVQSGQVYIWPVGFNLNGYNQCFNNPNILIGFRNSIGYTIVGTLWNISLTMMCAYPMARSDLPGRNIFMFLFSFTMFFGGGMIPSYILNRSLGLVNTVWVMVLPLSMSVYNMIVARTFIASNIPKDMLEAASIDGCSDAKFFTAIVIPLSKAVIAVLVLFYGVGHWNQYFHAMIYLSDRNIFPLQLFLKEILLSANIDPSTVSDPELAAQLATLVEVIKYSVIVVALVPVLLVYPFVQKYFVKGVMIGAIKG